jgi:hypothetical protein
MKTCNNCYYFDNCSEGDKSGGRCEYYYSLYAEENIVLNEYEESLRERVEVYQEIIDEFNEE